MLESLGRPEPQHTLRYPENHLDPLLRGMIADFPDVKPVDGVEDILVPVPAVVYQYVLYAVFRGEVYVVEVGLGIDSGLEIDSVAAYGIPPVPGRLARLDPGDVVEFARRRKLVDHVVHGKALFIFGVCHYAPGVCACAFDDVQIVEILSVLHLRVVRVRREFRLEALVRRAEEHPRIGPQVGFGKEKASGIAKVDVYGHEGQPSVRLGCVSGIHLIVEALERSAVSVIFGYAGIRYQHSVWLAEIELRLFAQDLPLPLHGGGETVGHSVVVGPEFKGPSSFHLESQSIVFCIELCLTVERSHYVFAPALPGLLQHLGILPEGEPLEFEGQVVVIQNFFASYFQRPSATVSYGNAKSESAGRA